MGRMHRMYRMYTPTMKRLLIVLPEDTHRRWKSHAAIVGMSMTDLVRQLIEEELAGIARVTMPEDPSSTAHPPMKGATMTSAIATEKVWPSRAKRPLPDLSKSAQAKGKMGR